MAATILVLVAGRRPVLPRPEGVRRGRDADGGEGVKLAVIGAGSTYTPELVSGLVGARRRRARAARHRRRAARGRRRARAADARPRRLRAAGSTLTGELERALDGADFVLIQIRVGGQAARLRDETRAARRAAASGRRRPAPAGFAKALRTVPVVLEIADEVRRRAAPGAWIVDFTNPVGIVTRALLDAGHRAVGLCNVAIGVPAARRAAARRRAGARRGRPGRPQPPHVGARGAPRRRRRARRAAGRPRRRARRRRRACRAGCSTSSAPCRPTTCTTSTSTTRCWPSSATARAARGRGRGDRARAAGDVPRPVAEREARAARAARRRVLQRGGDRARARRWPARGDAVHVVDMRNDGTLAGLADDDVVEVPARVGPRRARRRSRRRRSRRSCSGSPSTSPPTSGSPREAALSRATRSTSRKALLAHPLIGQDEMAGELLERLLAGEPVPMSGASSSPSTAATRRPTSRCVRDDGAVLALVRGGMSSPHHLGLDGCVALLEQLLDGRARSAGARRRRRRRGRPAAAGRRSTSRTRSERAARARSPRAAGRDALTRRQRHVRRAARRHRARLGRRGGVRRRASTASASAPDGRHARFPALGAISGDWGGGYDVGLAALSAPRRAARTAAGRGRALERAVPAHFGLRDAGRARRGDPPRRDRRSGGSSSSPPLVFAAAATDPVAAAIVDRLAAEVRRARATSRCARLELAGAAGRGPARRRDVPSAPTSALLGAIERAERLGAASSARRRRRRRSSAPRCSALDELGAPGEAQALRAARGDELEARWPIHG